MGKFIQWLVEQPLFQKISTVMVYLLHWTVVAVAATPAVFFLLWAWRTFLTTKDVSVLTAFLLSLAFMLAYLLYMVSGVVIFGLFIRLMSWGITPGSYTVFSWTGIRWLLFSGIYNIAGETILSYIFVSPLINAFFRIIGCKMGKNVRINTAFLNDAYLLTLGDNVVLGGKATLSCHIFEQDRLILKPITIGSNCVVGAHAYVHPGVVMEDNSVIGIYALVPKDTVIHSKTIHGHLPALPYRELARLTRLSRGKAGD